jgi:hypothetical protein
MSAPSIQQRTSKSRVLVTASRAVTILEHFRIPYHVSDSAVPLELDRISLGSDGPAILWPTNPADLGDPVATTFCWNAGTPMPLFCPISSEQTVRSLLARQGGDWSPVAGVLTMDRKHVASVWRCDDGSLFLPFDPDEVRLSFLRESYHEALERQATRQWRRLAMHTYYSTRDAMPRALQIWLRRRYARVQARCQFPRWPVETALDDFLNTFVSMLGSIAGEPIPTIAAWPGGCSWALVLTHDVETAAGVAAMDSVLDLERSLGVRSAWNFVPRRYDVSLELIRDLVADGFEVGVHGLYHDGRDLESETVLRERLPGIRDAAARWGSAGFRSPATHRGWDLMPLLGFDYDSSYPDTDPFEPQSGGCCSWLPFFNKEMVELPLTMPQDHTLFTILRQPDERTWVEKAEFLRSRGGMALIDTHPDYLADKPVLTAYRRFLEHFVNDKDAWRALPGDVSTWWRRRAQSSLERDGEQWVVRGPAAADARVELRTADHDGIRGSAIGQASAD